VRIGERQDAVRIVPDKINFTPLCPSLLPRDKNTNRTSAAVLMKSFNFVSSAPHQRRITLTRKMSFISAQTQPHRRKSRAVFVNTFWVKI
jgi:hypothetical protein